MKVDPIQKANICVGVNKTWAKLESAQKQAFEHGLCRVFSQNTCVLTPPCAGIQEVHFEVSPSHSSLLCVTSYAPATFRKAFVGDLDVMERLQADYEELFKATKVRLMQLQYYKRFTRVTLSSYVT